MNANTKKYQLTISNIFTTARIYALISIVCAHIYFADSVVSAVFSRVGTVGVITFLMMSGFFYRPKKFKSFSAMIKKKLLTVVIPWIILGTLTWLYNFLLSNNTSNWFIRYFKWIIGNGSYLYYLTVLFVCFLIFYKHNKITLIIVIMLNIVSIILTAMGLLNNILMLIGINNYLNLFNWIGFFSLGILLQDIKEKQILAFLHRTRFVFIILFNAVLVTLVIFSTIKVTYFSFIAIPFELLGVLAIMGVSTFNLTKIKCFRIISNYSFTIYLIHMVVMGILDVFFEINIILTILSPVLIIIACSLILWSVLFVAKKIKLEKFARLILGIRDR